MISLRAIALALLLALAPAAGNAQTAAVGDLSVDGAWTRATAPSARNGGAFMTITNSGDNDDRLVAASTEVAARTELHTHRMEGGMMRMRPVEGGIDVPAGGTTELRPGGLHVMMMGLKAPLVEGTAVTIELTFERAGPVTVTVPVMKAGALGPAGAMPGHGMKPQR